MVHGVLLSKQAASCYGYITIFGGMASIYTSNYIKQVIHMATRLMGSGSTARHPGYREFFVDDEADIEMLPSTPEEIAWGAVALVIATANVYILGRVATIKK